MRSVRGRVLAGVVVACVLSLLAVAFRLGAPREPPASLLEIPGGDGASLPVATPVAQGLDAEALQAASATADRAGARALLIARRGHLVLVHEPTGAAGARVRAALLTRLVLGAGLAAVYEQRGTTAEPPLDELPAGTDARGFARELSVALWQPLAAAAAGYELDADGNPRLRCCLWLRPRDGLAVAAALQAGGQIAGQRLLSAAAAGRVLTGLRDGIAPRGAEPFGARPAQVLRDDEGTRLYFFPAQELVILLVGAQERLLQDETELAHQVLRGIVDNPAGIAPRPGADELVPQHDAAERLK